MARCYRVKHTHRDAQALTAPACSTIKYSTLLELAESSSAEKVKTSRPGLVTSTRLGHVTCTDTGTGTVTVPLYRASIALHGAAVT